VNNIAEWDGANWSGLGAGMIGGVENPIVYALEVDNAGNLYAGGDFRYANWVEAFNVAKWNNTSWEAMGSGLGVALSAPWNGMVMEACMPGALSICQATHMCGPLPYGMGRLGIRWVPDGRHL